MNAREPRIHLRSHRALRALRYGLLVLLAGVALAVVLTFGRRGARPAEITMGPTPAPPPGQGPVVDRSDRFEVHGTREGRPAFTLRAGSVTGFAGERKLLQAVDLTLHPPEGGAIRILGSEGQFDAAARRAQINGDVSIASDDGLRLETGTLFYDSDRNVVFTADPIAFSVGGIEGQGRGLNYLVGERRLKIPDQVSLHVPAGAGLAETSVSSGDLIAVLGDNTVVFTGDVRLKSGADVLRANYLKLDLDPGRQWVRELRAFGEEVVATLAPRGSRAGGELAADSLTARFAGPDGTIEEAEASGRCRFASGPYTSRSRTARYVQAADRLELRGDPVVISERDRIAAQEIDLYVGAQALEARGEVRTVSLPGGGASGTPGFSGRSATSFQARTLRAEQAARRAVYRGAARAWQEGNSLQAEEIVVDHGARQVRATESVMARFTQRPAGRTGAAFRPAVTTIAARSLVLDDAAGVAAYRDDVRLARPDATLTADAMDAYLTERDGVRALERVVATGSVAVKRANAYGSGRAAEYRASADLLVLTDPDGLAEVVDAATGRTLRGRTLTFDLAGDRILTEPAPGARTWITLKPEGKDIAPVEPKTDR